MGNVTVFTADRTKAIEDAQFTGVTINGAGRLIFTRKNAQTVDAGYAKGDKGDTGAAGVGFVGVAIPSTDTLNNYRTPGVFLQPTNANATTGNGYPVAAAGVLEVFASGNVNWQRYSVYNGTSYANTVWVRTTNTAGTWGVWKCVNVPKLNVKASCDTTLNLTTTAQTLSGTSTTITSLGTDDVFYATMAADVSSLGTTATTAILRLTVDGTAQAEQGRWSNGAIASLIGMVSQQWQITGLAAGDHTFALTAARSGGADSMVRVNATNTNLIVIRN